MPTPLSKSPAIDGILRPKRSIRVPKTSSVEIEAKSPTKPMFPSIFAASESVLPKFSSSKNEVKVSYRFSCISTAKKPKSSVTTFQYVTPFLRFNFKQLQP